MKKAKWRLALYVEPIGGPDEGTVCEVASVKLGDDTLGYDPKTPGVIERGLSRFWEPMMRGLAKAVREEVAKHLASLKASRDSDRSIRS